MTASNVPDNPKPLTARFRKKPVVIEAVQLTWSTWSEICDFVPRKSLMAQAIAWG